MTAIRGYAQLLTLEKFGRIGDEQRKILETIIRNIDRLDKLLNDILDVSRLESGTLKITPERCRIEEIIDNAVETMEGHARLKNIRIEKMVEYDLPDLLLDKNRMEQVITNLLSNAIKFSNRNSRILVRAKRDGENVVLEVQDFGRGIPKSKLNKIFEPFYQVDTGMDRKFGGAGLGLTIVKGIIEAHGGRVEVDSKLGEGSTFRIILPVEHVEKKGKVKIFSER
ncbi:MAG TPA: HAMP domain-containing histidine kinase, partial [Thermoplasmatales archaeon]|nr:HAMP domain-containing histidine kinase [Thermoplasmatales archaeon]HEX17375.1 HAMP domain-containing histidine kinase [Thermoplasmatales archaeon]